jgi:hypothetical protein
MEDGHACFDGEDRWVHPTPGLTSAPACDHECAFGIHVSA